MQAGTNGFKSGFIAVVGRPNVGKSTLVNRLVGVKVSITSPRAQTTRSPIRGVRNGPGYQAVFVDTPGSQKPRDTLRSRMQQQVLDSLYESDVVLVLFDAAQGDLGTGDRYVARIVAEARTPAIACLNKVDLLRDPSEAFPIIEEISGLAKYEDVFLLSAKQGLNAEPLIETVPATSRRVRCPTTRSRWCSPSTSERRLWRCCERRCHTLSPSR